MTARKIIMLVLDGISDRPCAILGGRTPLQVAKKPILDKLAEEGICGIMDTIGPGVRPGSDTSHLSLLGYDPQVYYTGRGPLEAEGCGIHMESGMIGFRCNYATLGQNGTIIDRRAGRIHDTQALSMAIEEGVDLSPMNIELKFASGVGHRAALALRGKGLGANVTSNDPKEEGVVPQLVHPLSSKTTDKKTAAACNEFIQQAQHILNDHPVNERRVREGLLPANTVLLRGAGEMGHFESFQERYGLTGGVIAAATLVVGIGKVVGLRHIPVSGATGSVATNLKGKIDAAIHEIERNDFILLNIKGADEASHDGNAVEKKEFIERIDTFLNPLTELEDCLLVLCSDHTTPCSIKDHSADPVPVVIHGPDVRTDFVLKFDENSCASGGLHRIRGSSLMPILLDLINKTHKYGA